MIFLQLQLMVVLGASLAYAVRRFAGLHPREELRVHYFLLAALPLLLVAPLPGQGDFALRPVAHVELGRAVFSAASVTAAPVVKIAGESAKGGGLPLQWCAALALALALAGLIAVALDYLRLHRLLAGAVVFRSVGRVRLAVAPAASPFSVRTARYAWVVLPPSFLQDPRDLRVAVAHELQHHRARDTVWCHMLAPLRALCFFHPLRVLWAAVITEAQELACDEELVNQKRRISAGDYSRVLIRAAEFAAREGTGRAYAAAPGFFSARRLLARRIESMYQTKVSKHGRALVLGIAASSLLAAGAWASGSWVVDSRISGRTMLAMAANARKGTDFPVQVNDDVLRELNHFMGTEKGREFVAKAEKALAELQPLLDREIERHHVPRELLAVGLVESGFQNLPQEANPSQHGAGVWQFIPSTARVFGLRVEGSVDDRLDIERETDAAFRYLSANRERYDDWLLGIMAYNMGERALDNAIQRAGTRNPWKLIAAGYEGDAGYLAKVMAALLILKNHENSL